MNTGTDFQGFQIFNNEQEVKEFFLKFHFIDISQVYELGIVLPSELEDGDEYTEFKDSKHLEFIDITKILLNPDIWHSYPLVAYFNYDKGWDRLGTWEMRLFDMTSLETLKLAK
jgi:hypothetical protein